MWQQRQHASPTCENAKHEVQLPTSASPRNPDSTSSNTSQKVSPCDQTRLLSSFFLAF